MILDGDGKYNDVIPYRTTTTTRIRPPLGGGSRACDSVSDKICQPTLHPLRPNVIPFLFYAYNPSWERPLETGPREFEMIYVGHSKFRWSPMMRRAARVLNRFGSSLAASDLLATAGIRRRTGRARCRWSKRILRTPTSSKAWLLNTLSPVRFRICDRLDEQGDDSTRSCCGRCFGA